MGSNPSVPIFYLVNEMTEEEIKMLTRMEEAERAIHMSKKLIIWERDGPWILSIVAIVSGVISLVCWFIK